MIRILHSVSNLDRGGIETMLMNYYRHMDHSKIQFDFLCNKKKKGAYDEEAQSMGARIFHTPGLNPLNYYKYIQFMQGLINNNPEYKVIEVHNGALGLLALHSAKFAGIPVRIYHAHGQGLNLDYKIAYKWLCKKFIKFNMTHHFTCGIKAGEYYFGKRIMETGNYEFIPNAINVEKFIYNDETRSILRKKYNLENKHVIGHVGRFMHQKNHKFLIEVFYKIAQKDKDAFLVLLGDGELQKKVSEQINSLGIQDKVLMIGNVPNANEWYQAFDLFILPSHWEGLPVVGVEAQAAGLPCIFSSSITQEIKLSDHASFISLKTSPKEWANEAISLLNSNCSRTNMHKLIADKGYDIKREAKKLEDLYIKLYSDTSIR